MTKQIGKIEIPIYEYVEGEFNDPPYAGEGVAIYGQRSKAGKDYISVVLFGSKGVRVACWKFEGKKQREE